MKTTRSKKIRRLMQEVDPQTEPKMAAALLRAARRLPVAEPKKVLATTDFSDASMEGVRFAVSFAEKFGARLALAHVIEPASPFSGTDRVVLAREDAEVIELAKRRIAELLPRTNLAVTSIVRRGKPFNEIAALARQRGADLVVIATRGHTGLKRFVLGSTTERVVRHAPCPVLTVPAKAKLRWESKAPTLQLRKVVVPIDASETSLQALPYAAALVERFGAEVILLHVIEPVAPTAPHSPSDVQNANQAMERRTAALLSRLCEEAFGEDVSARAVVRFGTPCEEITKAAKNLRAGMIVLTTHGYTGLTHVLLGSTAERVVRYAPCPVLVVRQTAARTKRPFRIRHRRRE